VDTADGGVEMKLRLGSLLEIERWILGWGGTATVLQPPELVEAVRASATAILARY
jgi:predicted DNA-binding transcriptional regulator YafY